MERLQRSLATEFEVKDLGPMQYFLGTEVARSKRGISLSQRKYVIDLLIEIGMLGCKPSDALVDVGKKNEDGGKPVEIDRYQSLESHLEAVYKILRYFKGSAGKGLLFKRGEKKDREVYTDADWPGSIEDRRSTIGYCAFVWKNLVTWRSKKQNVVAKRVQKLNLEL
ncbi:uncharacterized protein LOC111381533 [Olea europaea var. sylvestris]|uniref:uncharacterized protein LOC111381533 n=1 Tax=Olea europaea var. sylvestris TaxID=158386 RepID=UPI000C1D15A0|nr:uncharacterized protein LOC111381533 [Olea europaea var. sylvestris]